MIKFSLLLILVPFISAASSLSATPVPGSIRWSTLLPYPLSLRATTDALTTFAVQNDRMVRYSLSSGVKLGELGPVPGGNGLMTSAPVAASWSVFVGLQNASVAAFGSIYNDFRWKSAIKNPAAARFSVHSLIVAAPVSGTRVRSIKGIPEMSIDSPQTVVVAAAGNFLSACTFFIYLLFRQQKKVLKKLTQFLF